MKPRDIIEDRVPYKMGLFWFEIPTLGGAAGRNPKTFRGHSSVTDNYFELMFDQWIEPVDPDHYPDCHIFVGCSSSARGRRILTFSTSSQYFKK